jgi:hypothetical protein
MRGCLLSRSCFALFASLLGSAAAACFLQSIAPPLGPTSGGTSITLSLQGEWPDGAQLDVGGTLYAAGELGEQATQGRLNFVMPPAAQPGDVVVSSPQCDGSYAQFQYYGNWLWRVVCNVCCSC